MICSLALVTENDSWWSMYCPGKYASTFWYTLVYSSSQCMPWDCKAEEACQTNAALATYCTLSALVAEGARTEAWRSLLSKGSSTSPESTEQPNVKSIQRCRRVEFQSRSRRGWMRSNCRGQELLEDFMQHEPGCTLLHRRISARGEAWAAFPLLPGRPMLAGPEQHRCAYRQTCWYLPYLPAETPECWCHGLPL
jgi:hypothetical protein